MPLEIPRRTFFKAGLVLGGALIASQFENNQEAEKFPIERAISYAQFDSISRDSSDRSPDLYGGIMNLPFPVFSNNPFMTSKLIEDMDKTNCEFVRLFARWEKPTGAYNLDYLSRVGDIISQLYTRSGGRIKSVFCLDDLFDMYHAGNFNPFYGSSTVTLTHHALNYASSPGKILERQKDFLTNPYWSEAYARKFKVLTEVLKPVWHCIAAIEAFNESTVPVGITDKPVELHTEFYDRMLQAIRDTEVDKPILTGLANPTDVDIRELKQYNVIQTAHVYFGKDSNEQKGLDKSIDERLNDPSLPPIALTEMGTPRKLYDFELPQALHDVILARNVRNSFLYNTRINHEKGTVSSGIIARGDWRIDIDAIHRDGFEYNTSNYPRTVQEVCKANSRLSFN